MEHRAGLTRGSGGGGCFIIYFVNSMAKIKKNNFCTTFALRTHIFMHLFLVICIRDM